MFQQTRYSPLLMACVFLLSSVALAQSPFLACPGIKAPADAVSRRTILQQIEITNETASELIRFLERSQEDLNRLRNWVRPYIGKDWPKLTVDQCNTDPMCRFFLHDLPIFHRRMRLYTALSISPSGRGLNAGMSPPPFGPLQGKSEPLTEEERDQAQAELNQFWDARSLSEEEKMLQSYVTGKPAVDRRGVIEDYMAILRRKKDLVLRESQRFDQITDELMRFEQSRLLPTANERIEKVMRFTDLDWIGYREKRLSEARKLMILEMWKLADQFRPLVYLKSAAVDPQNVSLALERSLQDSQAMIAQIQDMQKNFSTFTPARAEELLTHSWEARRARKDMEWLMDFQTYTESVLKRRPDLCAAAVTLHDQIERRDLVTNVGTLILAAAPLLLLIPPVAVAVGAAGATMLAIGSTGTIIVAAYSSITDYNDVRQKYMIKTPIQETPLANLNMVLKSQSQAIAVPTVAVLSLAIPMLKASTITRVLNAPIP